MTIEDISIILLAVHQAVGSPISSIPKHLFAAAVDRCSSSVLVDDYHTDYCLFSEYLDDHVSKKDNNFYDESGKLTIAPGYYFFRDSGRWIYADKLRHLSDEGPLD